MGVTTTTNSAATYVPISTQTLSTTPTTVTISSIPSTYTDLIIVINGGCQGGGLRLRFNSDTGTNYSATALYGNGTSAASTRFTSQNGMDIAGIAAGMNATATSILQVQNYSNSTTYKTLLNREGFASGETIAVVGLWRSTSAITQVDIYAINGTGTWYSGSTITLYGILGA